MEEGEKLELMVAGLPVQWGEATTKLPGFIGEAPRYPSILLHTVMAEWEQLAEDRYADATSGLPVVPYIMTTEAENPGNVAWKTSEVRGAVREFMATPTDSNMRILSEFQTETAGPGQPDQPMSLQKYAWPASAAVDDDAFVEEGDEGRFFFLHILLHNGTPRLVTPCRMA